MESKNLFYRRDIQQCTQDAGFTELIRSSFPFFLQGSVPRWRPSCGVSGRWPGAEGEVSKAERPGSLPVSGQ